MSNTLQHAVVIVGAGPTGLMLAAELALAHVDVVVVERRETQDLPGTRAGGLHARTIEVLDQRGVAERFVSQGQTVQALGLGYVPLHISDFPTRHPYVLALGQNAIERILADWVAELRVPILRDVDVTGFVQDEHGIDVALSDGRTLRASYLVGCDGGRSFVRKHAGIDFAGWDASASSIIAEVEMSEEPAPGLHKDKFGVYGMGKIDGGFVRVVLREEQVGKGDPTLEELRGAIVALYGKDFGLRGARWLSRFSDLTRQATSYRSGRVLLAGDSAHVHSPVGGQGLNLGVQDAMNLGWKLAQVVRGTSHDDLLDSYHAERHPVGARVLRTTMASTALGRVDDRVAALVEVVADLLTIDEARKRYAGLMSGLDIRYDLGPGHALLGRRMPDLDLVTTEGRRRVFSFMHDARPVLLNLGDATLDVAAWADRVRMVHARYDGVWDLPVLGPVAAPSAVLIRPDGYVGWIGDGTDMGLRDALTRWFGATA